MKNHFNRVFIVILFFSISLGTSFPVVRANGFDDEFEDNDTKGEYTSWIISGDYSSDTWSYSFNGTHYVEHYQFTSTTSISGDDDYFIIPLYAGMIVNFVVISGAVEGWYIYEENTILNPSDTIYGKNYTYTTPTDKNFYIYFPAGASDYYYQFNVTAYTPTPNTIMIDYPADFEYIQGYSCVLNWTPCLSAGIIPDPVKGYELYINDTMIQSSTYSDETTVSIDIKEDIPGIYMYYEVRMRFYASWGWDVPEYNESITIIHAKPYDGPPIDVEPQQQTDQYHNPGDLNTLIWTVQLDPALSADGYKIYQNGEVVQEGTYQHGEDVSFDIPQDLGHGEWQNFTLWLNTVEGHETQITTNIFIRDFARSLNVTQDPLYTMDYNLNSGDEAVVTWNATVSEGFTAKSFTLYVNGTKYNETSYTSGVSIKQDISKYLDNEGTYNITVVFSTHEGTEVATTLLVTVEDVPNLDDTTDDTTDDTDGPVETDDEIPPPLTDDTTTLNQPVSGYTGFSLIIITCSILSLLVIYSKSKMKRLN